MGRGNKGRGRSVVRVASVGSYGRQEGRRAGRMRASRPIRSSDRGGE